MEVKEFQVKDFSLTTEGEVKVAFAEFGAVDREGDYTFPGAMPDGKELPISAYSHASWPAKGGLLPTGRGSIKEDGGLAVFDGRFFMKTSHGRDTYETVKEMGGLQEWSYGYEVLEKAAPPKGVKAKRGLKLLDVFEISPVLIGAGSRTFTMGIKSVDELLAADLEGLESDEAIQQLLKDGPLAGLSFAEMSSRVLRDVEAFTGRAASIADMRLKEGRAISGARQAELTGSRERLAEAIAAIDKILADAAPKTTDDESEAKARLMRMRSRLGVANLELASIQH